MILKVFIKINKNKQPVVEGELNKFYESDEIFISPPKNGNDKIVTFELSAVKDGVNTTITGKINLDTHGYELTNSKGILMERFISKKNL